MDKYKNNYETSDMLNSPIGKVPVRPASEIESELSILDSNLKGLAGLINVLMDRVSVVSMETINKTPSDDVCVENTVRNSELGRRLNALNRIMDSEKSRLNNIINRIQL